MENIKVLKKKEEKNLIVDKCINCSSKDLIPMKDFKHEFDEQIQIDDGIFCPNCKSFHYMEDGNLTYELIYKDMYSKVEEVKWNIMDN